MRLFFYGVPGVGKTHDARVFGSANSIPVFEADSIKQHERAKYSKQEKPFLYLGSCLAFKQFGQLNKENAVKGLLAVRDALRRPVLDVVQKYEVMILEGAFLDPYSLLSFGIPILFVVNDKRKHKQQFLHHREKLFDVFGHEFQSARIIQEYLIQEAQRLGIYIFDLDERDKMQNILKTQNNRSEL